ncbi:hypothetical protein BFO_1999 [Tannerella forsythia 92A2]|uniref:Uncharacterized protein n=1 Tax=Tannerella forsythia (strain ATCC 43037 / JCM 10827 / CCUG 21028 A / KCTC 5666 / FDC 338) TaxID=203275 RepID=G8UQ72_TANFA|nr:hypothetical protein BFO_1999 [Tannerella forsythia 92A2]
MLRFGQPDFLSSCSLLRRLTARGPWTNAEMNGQWLFSKYMIWRVPRITINH